MTNKISSCFSSLAVAQAQTPVEPSNQIQIWSHYIFKGKVFQTFGLSGAHKLEKQLEKNQLEIGSWLE
jgi:hypothetical protein